MLCGGLFVLRFVDCRFVFVFEVECGGLFVLCFVDCRFVFVFEVEDVLGW